MFSTNDTIVAIATPAGRGGIGVVRISGPQADVIGQELIRPAVRLAARHATLARFESPTGVTDQVVVTFFPAPASYTGEHVIEISAHGSPVILRAIVAEAMARGARLAEPGEFTLRAFLNERLDLPQAEAVVDLVDAVTPLQARAAFDQLNGTLSTAIADMDAVLFDLVTRLEASVDFPDEGYHFIQPAEVELAIDTVRARALAMIESSRRGRLLREGRQIAVVGAPNAGKSTLFNALVGAGRSIVTDVPGTTRDLVVEAIDFSGMTVTLVDTAGVRQTTDPVESEGVSRAFAAMTVADVVWWLVDRSEPKPSLDHFEALAQTHGRVLLIASKSDLTAAWDDPRAIRVSVLHGEGLLELKSRTLELLEGTDSVEVPALTNLRHVALVERGVAALDRAQAGLKERGSRMVEELVLCDLADARNAFEEVIGRRTSEDVLQAIFSRFCIGK